MWNPVKERGHALLAALYSRFFLRLFLRSLGAARLGLSPCSGYCPNVHAVHRSIWALLGTA
jgi:hypothetical protein